MFAWDQWLLSVFKLKQWPPILIPVVIILFFVVAPIYYSIPFLKWLFGFWKCRVCSRTYGPKTERITRYSGYGEVAEYECIHCQVAQKLEESK